MCDVCRKQLGLLKQANLSSIIKEVEDYIKNEEWHDSVCGCVVETSCSNNLAENIVKKLRIIAEDMTKEIVTELEKKQLEPEIGYGINYSIGVIERLTKSNNA